jgi:hypothetical protein
MSQPSTGSSALASGSQDHMLMFGWLWELIATFDAALVHEWGDEELIEAGAS